MQTKLLHNNCPILSTNKCRYTWVWHVTRKQINTTKGMWPSDQLPGLGTPFHGNNMMMDTKSATLVNSLSPGKLLYHIKAVSFKLISRHLEHPWEISHSACHRTWFLISQHCSRHWPGAVRRQPITWGNDDRELTYVVIGRCQATMS